MEDIDYYNHPEFYNINHLFEGEIWKDIEGHEGYYQISNCGRAKGIYREFECNNKYGSKSIRKVKPVILRQVFSRKNGYLVIGLSKNHKFSNKSIHTLVARAFIENPKNKPQVNHKRGDKTRNHYTLLEWSTAKENTAHAIESGLRKPQASGDKSGKNKITEAQVKELRNTYKPGDSKLFAAKYNVSESNIFAILQRRRWKHVL